MPNMKDLFVEGWATDYDAGTAIEPHAHNAHQVIHAISGVMRINTEGGIWVVPPGRSLWVPAGMVHEIRCVSLVKMRTAYVYGDAPGFPQSVQVSTLSPLLREILVRLAAGPSSRQQKHLVALLVDEIAGGDPEILHIPFSQDRRIFQMSAAILETPGRRHSLADWANELGMSERNLIRCIRRETGLSFRELRRQVRLVASLEKLALGEPVTLVAFDVGFESPSAFIQAFRAVTGKTPGRYTKAHIKSPV